MLTTIRVAGMQVTETAWSLQIPERWAADGIPAIQCWKGLCGAAGPNFSFYRQKTKKRLTCPQSFREEGDEAGRSATGS